MKGLIEAVFGNGRFISMFDGRILDRNINHLHERSLRIVWKDCI